jgi:tetratricopeptide (TPR) repeat protein
MTSWHRNEYILKGLFLGLWAFVALQVAVDKDAVRIDLPWILGWVGGGLLLGLLAGTVLQFRRGVRPWQNWTAFPLLVLLESPTFIYGGIVFGLAVGVLSGREFSQPWAEPIAGWFGLTFADIKHEVSEDQSKPGDWLLYCALGGAILGYGLSWLRQVVDPWRRFGIGLGLAAVCIYFAAGYLTQVPGLNSPDAKFNLGVYILLGLPFFYLLTFCGEAEESEAEIMALCAALGVSLDLMDLTGKTINIGKGLPLILPATIYFIYVTRVLPGLRVFKHVLRGYSYMNLGRIRESVYFFRRAIQLDPKSSLAAEGLRGLHSTLSLAKLDRDPQLTEFLDFSLCLDRAERHLFSDHAPTPAERSEAERFLDLVQLKKPVYQARVDYLRAVSRTHAKDYDAAADTLSRLLDPETPGYHPAVRNQVLLPAWTLALKWSQEIERRVGWKELDRPGRRIEAIGAVERRLATDPQDTIARELKTVLYTQLSEGEFVAAAANGLPQAFNYDFVEQLGLGLADESDPDRRERGMAYLRIAGRGLPSRGPGIFTKLAEMSTKAGDLNARSAYLEQVKRCGMVVTPGELAKDQRDLYTIALRALAADAETRGDEAKAEADTARERGDLAGMAAKDAEARPFYESAITDLRLYLEAGGRNELDTYRKLADLYGKSRATPNAVINAILNTETALTYNSSDADLLKKKDTYYYSLGKDDLIAVKEKVANYFDVAYCVRKASTVLNKSDDPDMLDWAAHLAQLAEVMQPTSNGVRLIRARCLLRRGERDTGIQLMEDIREGKKGSGDEEDAWYAATKILGDLYLDELNRPDLAIRAFADYKDHGKSGADTLFKLARAYEAQGDLKNAIKFYSTVTAYEEHPRYWDAKEALRRLGKE